MQVIADEADAIRLLRINHGHHFVAGPDLHNIKITQNGAW